MTVQVKQAAAHMHRREQRRMSHQENLFDDLDDVSAVLAQRGAHGTFCSTISFQGDSTFEEDKELHKAESARWDLLRRLKGTMADCDGAVANVRVLYSCVLVIS